MLSAKVWEPNTSRISTGLTCPLGLGTSMPTVEILLGMGATRTPGAPRARAMSLDRLVILLSFTPWSSSSSYRVTEGPRVTLMMLASMPKEWMVSVSRVWLLFSSPATPAASLSRPSFKRVVGGYW